MSAASSQTQPAWDTWAAGWRRTFLFLILAAAYVSFQVVFHFIDYSLFGNDNWFPFELEEPAWFEVLAQWFLTWLSLAAVGCLTWLVLGCLLDDAPGGRGARASLLGHRRVPLGLIFLGLILAQPAIFLGHDPERLQPSDFLDLCRAIAVHAGFLLISFILSGPERSPTIEGILEGPLRMTYFGKACRILAFMPRPTDLQPEWNNREAR